MIRDNSNLIYKEYDSKNVIPFLDPVENLHQTLNLLKMPDVVSKNTDSVEQLHAKIDALQNFIIKISENINNGEEWKPTHKAMKYLGMCQNSFDKYRYETKIKIPGHKLDKMNWYKRSDLDLFMLTYEAKSKGLA